jgi:hypothetical protein
MKCSIKYSNFRYYGKLGDLEGIWVSFSQLSYPTYYIELAMVSINNNICKRNFNLLFNTNNINKLKNIFGE